MRGDLPAGTAVNAGFATGSRMRRPDPAAQFEVLVLEVRAGKRLVTLGVGKVGGIEKKRAVLTDLNPNALIVEVRVIDARVRRLVRVDLVRAKLLVHAVALVLDGSVVDSLESVDLSLDGVDGEGVRPSLVDSLRTRRRAGAARDGYLLTRSVARTAPSRASSSAIRSASIARHVSDPMVRACVHPNGCARGAYHFSGECTLLIH